MGSRPKKGSTDAPTDAELDILRILWRRGPSTVREVHKEVLRSKPVAYTTVLSQMQIMHQKGHLRRSERFTSHLYEPAKDKALVQRGLVQTLLHKAFDGSATGLLQSAFDGRRVEASEIA